MRKLLILLLVVSPGVLIIMPRHQRAQERIPENKFRNVQKAVAGQYIVVLADDVPA